MRAATVAAPSPVFVSFVLLLLSLALSSSGLGCAYPVEAQDVDDTTPTDPGATTPMPPTDEGDYMNRQGASGGWSHSGTLTAGNTTKIVTAQYNPGAADNWIVEFSVSQPKPLALPAPNNLVAIFPEALVQWTVEGNTLSRRISVGNGTTIEGAAQSIRVTVYDNSNIPGTPNVDYGVTFSIARGTRAPSAAGPVLQLLDPRTGPTTLGQPGILLNGGAPNAVTLQIPQDSGATSVYFSTSHHAPGDAFGQVNFIGAGSYTFGALTYASFDLSDTDQWIPLPPGGTSIQISAPSAIVLVNVILGIDG